MKYKEVKNYIINTDKNDGRYKRYDYSKTSINFISNIRGTGNNIKDSR